MDWITGIQHALDYVERHITQPIDFEEVAKQAYSSSFHFQRVFSLLCGYTLGDYIRMRRLTLAGNELNATGIRVIDAAMKYGYDSSESFSRAFTRFHGISPSQAKAKGSVLRSFSPLSVKLILDGGTTMEYRVETIPAFNVICKKKQIPAKEELATSQISAFWQACSTDGTTAALQTYAKPDPIFGGNILGINFGADAKDAAFPYAVGAAYNGAPVKEPDLTVENIPAHTYVVFPYVGMKPEGFAELFRQIYGEFFPTSEYRPCGGTDFEVYPGKDISAPNYRYEIWIAVEKK